MTAPRDLIIGGGVAAAGAVVAPRATVMAVVLSLAVAFAGARRAALVLLVMLVAGAIAGLRLDELPAADP